MDLGLYGFNGLGFKEGLGFYGLGGFSRFNGFDGFSLVFSMAPLGLGWFKVQVLGFRRGLM